MIWRHLTTIQSIQESLAGTMCQHLGMEFTEIGDDYLVAKMPVDHRTKQPAGLLHGGASVALAETMGSIASSLCIDMKTSMPVGIEINANHLKMVESGIVVARVKPIKRGRTLQVWEIKIETELGDLVCVSRLTVMIIKKRAGSECAVHD